MTTYLGQASNSTTAMDGTSSSTGYPSRGTASANGVPAVYGLNNSSGGGAGVYGAGYPGVQGQADRTNGICVKALDGGHTNATCVDAECTGTGSTAVYCTSPYGYGLYCLNSGYVGVLSKGSGSFCIDYPIVGKLGTPSTHYLFHGFVESDVAVNFYPRNVKLDALGAARIEMPEWFSAVCGESSLTLGPKRQAMPGLYWDEDGPLAFSIAGGVPNGTVSVTISARRVDRVEQMAWKGTVREKVGSEKGKYIQPEAHGKHATEDHVLWERHAAHSAIVLEKAAADARRVEDRKAELRAQIAELEEVQS